MNENTTRKLQDFDALFSSDRIQILKLLVSYTSGSVHKMIILYIKFLEIQIALHLSDSQSSNTFSKEPFDPSSFLTEIDTFCHTTETSSIRSLLQTMQSWQELKDTIELFQTMQGAFMDDNIDPSSNSDNSSINIMDLMQFFMGKESSE